MKIAGITVTTFQEKDSCSLFPHQTLFVQKIIQLSFQAFYRFVIHFPFCYCLFSFRQHLHFGLNQLLDTPKRLLAPLFKLFLTNPYFSCNHRHGGNFRICTLSKIYYLTTTFVSQSHLLKFKWAVRTRKNSLHLIYNGFMIKRMSI